MQNNGANSAMNGGNTVAAIIADCNCTGTNTFTVASNQSATVSGPSATVTTSNNTNTVTNNAFTNYRGVSSVTQNNGPNSAINNGNTVAAIVN
ncbi:MAG: hypothetical protein ACREGL_04255, partial [Alphaproteobacteria bacterium]